MKSEIVIKRIVECDCKDFEDNMIEVDKPWGLWSAHGDNQGYEGKPFLYCPWCGKRLKGKKDEGNEMLSSQ